MPPDSVHCRLQAAACMYCVAAVRDGCGLHPLQVPVAAAIGGGYCPDHERIVDRHLLLHQAAAELMPRLEVAAAYRTERRVAR